MTRLQLALDLYLKGLYRTVTSIDSTWPKIFLIIIILNLSLMNKFYRNPYFRVAYVQLESVFGKIAKLESFQLGSFQLERSILSWKEPFEVGKLEMKLERYVVVGKTICSWKDIDVVRKIRLGVKLGWSRRISSTKFLQGQGFG